VTPAEAVSNENHLPDGIWGIADAWFAAHGLSREFRHLVNITQTSLFFGGLGNVLDEIRRPESLALLHAWSDASPAAAALPRLGIAVNEYADFPSNFTAYSDTRSARAHLGNSLRRCYLLALFITRYPEGSREKAWLARLRLWLITHAFQRALSQSLILDANHRRVAEALRICCEDLSRGISSQWLPVFLGTLTSSSDWSTLNSQIRGFANHHRETKTFPDSTQDLLRAIVSVTTGEPLPISGAPEPSFWVIPTHSGSADGEQPLAFLEEEERTDLPASTFIAGNDDEGDVIGLQTPDNLSLTQERQLEKSVLLYSCEEQQYLPWSLSRPNPVQSAALKSWLQNAGSQANISHRLSRALIWTAATLSRSIARASVIEISTESAAEWRLHPDGYFHRHPPARYSGWGPKSELENRWVHPSLSNLVVQPPTDIAQTFLEALSRLPASPSLMALWAATGNPLKPQQACASVLADISPGLTPGMLAGMLPLQSYFAQRNHNFARLIASHPASGLPGACGYGYWDAEECLGVFSGIGGSVPVALAETDLRARAAGSRLCPIETLIVNTLAKAAQKVDDLRELDDPIQFHNAFVTFGVVMVLAATGGRPIRDPFESLRFFDFDEKFVYIEDKVIDGLHQGRLVPLPDAVGEFLQQRYLSHLSKLAEGLQQSAPDLANEIALLATKPSGRLPLFFFLGEDAQGFQWRSVSESEIAGLGLFDWPLPLNLFRHRLSWELRVRGLDPEIIDAILGHAETGSMTHSDYGLRTWEEDVALARPVVDAAYRALRIPSIKGWETTPKINISRACTAPVVASFGIKARAEQRHDRVRRALSDAKHIVREYLGDRKLEDLSPEQVDALAKLLLLGKSGLPHPSGHLRYQYLVRLIERTWTLRNKRVRLRRRYFRAEESTPFTSVAPGSKATLDMLRGQLADIAKGQTGRPAKISSISLGALHLCIESRIADPKLLIDVLEGNNFRLVSLNQAPYLEYAVGLTRNRANAAVRRFPLTWPVAQSLHTALSNTKKPSKNADTARASSDTPVSRAKMPPLECLAPIIQEVARHQQGTPAASMEELIHALCKIIDQRNVCQFPGVIAAYLSGRTRYAALGWYDWARLVTGRRLEFARDEDTERPVPAAQAEIKRSSETISRSMLDLQKNSKELFRAISTLLLQDPEANSRDSRRRQSIAKKCSEEIKSREEYVSPGIAMLAWWIHGHIFTGRTRERQTLSTIARYLAALAPGFLETVYNIDFFKLDGEEITSLYSDLMDARHVEDKNYVAQRLISFQRHIHAEFGIENPDWSELPEFPPVLRAAPCVISEAEYQEVLTQLLKAQAVALRLRLARCFVLLCCYRFGLRPRESWGLLRLDWAQTGEHVVVLVRKNRHRTVKTRAGRRQVPLLFELSEQEKQIIDQWQLEVESQFGTKDNIPLFFDDSVPEQPINLGQTTRAISDALKRATGNRDVSLHDARHSATSRLLLQLQGLDFSIWQSFFEETDAKNNYIESILLGTCGLTRRRSWALARYIGHAHPSTTFGNYIHHLDFWLARLLDLDAGAVPRVVPRHIVDLDNHSDQEIEAAFDAPVVDEKFSPAQILKFARLLARGQDLERAAVAQGVPLSIATDVQQLFERLSQRGKFSAIASREGEKKKRRQYEFLQRIGDNAWTRLLDFAHEIANVTAPALAAISMDEFNSMLSSRWQLVVWKPQQFGPIRELADILASHHNRNYYRILRTIDCDKILLLAAEQQKFEVEAIDAAIGPGAPSQLGTVEIEGGAYRVERRCAFVYLENNSTPIRNSLELFLVTVALWAANQNMP